MAIDKIVKKRVIEDWQNAFPQLTSYAQGKLYKVLGPIIIGVELIKLPRTEEYRPHFVVYSLFGGRLGNDISACLAGPILLQEYYDKKGFQHDIAYEKHNLFFDDVLDCVKEQTPLPFEGNVSFKKLTLVFDEYSKTSPLSAAPGSYLQAALLAAKLKIALFIGVEEAQSVLEQINRRSWDVNHFKVCGVDINNWLQGLGEIILDRDKFLERIEINKQDKKIAKLKSSELVV